jgi:hypothetical protein
MRDRARHGATFSVCSPTWVLMLGAGRDACKLADGKRSGLELGRPDGHLGRAYQQVAGKVDLVASTNSHSLHPALEGQLDNLVTESWTPVVYRCFHVVTILSEPVCSFPLELAEFQGIHS